MQPTMDAPEAGHSDYAIPLVVAASVVTWLGFAQGGYLPTTWGWMTLCLMWVGTTVLLLRRGQTWGLTEWLWIGGAVGLVGWTALSAFWSDDVTATVHSVSRDVLYVTIAIATLCIARRAAARALADGALIGTTLIAMGGLATYLFPDRFGLYAQGAATGRLFYPVGYWNAAGVLAAIGVFLALGAADGRTRIWRGVAAASLPILALVLYFSSSRGAVAAVVIAGVVLIGVSPSRLRTLALIGLAAPWCAAAIAVAYGFRSLAGQNYSLASAGDGHRMAMIGVALALLCGVCFALAPLHGQTPAPQREEPGGVKPRQRTHRQGALAGAAVSILVVFVAAVGLVGLSHVADSKVTTDGGARFSSTSLNGRVKLWEVAWSDFVDHPVLGSGAGTFEEVWSRHAVGGFNARWSHSVELGALAELGVVGLATLCLFLLTPMVGFGAIRAQAGMPAVLAAYVVYLVQSATDWDWQIPVTTATAILCAAVLIVAQRRPHPVPTSARVTPRYVAAGIAVAVALIFTVATLHANELLASSSAAASQGRWQAAAADARSAHRWAPWSYEPFVALGAAELGGGDPAAARSAFLRAADKAPRRWQIRLSVAAASTGRARIRALSNVMRLDPNGYEVRTFCFATFRKPCSAIAGLRG